MRFSPLDWLKHVAYSRVPWFATFTGKEIIALAKALPNSRRGPEVQLVTSLIYP
jgi:hypothetical protein